MEGVRERTNPENGDEIDFAPRVEEFFFDLDIRSRFDDVCEGPETVELGGEIAARCQFFDHQTEWFHPLSSSVVKRLLRQSFRFF